MNEAHWLPKSPQIFWKVYSAAINYKFEFLPMLLRISQIDVKANPYHRSPYILSFAVTASWDYLLGRECAWCDFFSMFFFLQLLSSRRGSSSVVMSSSPAAAGAPGGSAVSGGVNLPPPPPTHSRLPPDGHEFPPEYRDPSKSVQQVTHYLSSTL